MKSLLVLLFPLLLTACVGTTPVGEPMSKSNLTSGQVSMTLKKNVTTQAEVVETFGAPRAEAISEGGDVVCKVHI